MTRLADRPEPTDRPTSDHWTDRLAARLILAHLWQSDQQGFRPEFGSPDESSEQTPAGFAIPRRAYALLEPYAASSLLGFA